MYLFETVGLVTSTAGFTFGSDLEPLQLCSAPIKGHPAKVVIVREGCSVSHGTLAPGTWTRTSGGLAIAVLPGVDVRRLTTRGQGCQLRIGFKGWTHHQFQTVWIGTIRQVRWRSGRWSIECVELAGSLQSRFGIGSSNQNLFHGLATTELDADYTAGDPDLTTDATSGWTFDSAQIDSAGVLSSFPFTRDGGYILRVTPNSGAKFYLHASNFDGVDDFTGLVNGRFGTTDADAAAGNTVEEVAHSQAHPIRIAARVLASSGTSPALDGGAGTEGGVNGDDDLFPASWGYGFRPAFLDRADMSFFVGLTGGDSKLWTMLVPDQQQDGYRWLSQWLQPGGFFLCTHQGKLTCRAVVSNEQTPGFVHLTEHDIVDLEEYQAWDDDSQVEYRGSRAVSSLQDESTQAQEPNLETRPTRPTNRRDILPVYDLDVDFWLDEITARLKVYDTRVPERVRVKLLGWRAGVASLGDVVRLTTSLLTRRTPGDEFDGAPGLVVAGGPDWFGATTTLELLFPPQSAARS